MEAIGGLHLQVEQNIDDRSVKYSGFVGEAFEAGGKDVHYIYEEKWSQRLLPECK